MSITTTDKLIAGFKPPIPLMKAGISPGTVAWPKLHSLWYAPGNPSAGVASSAGVNGEALSGGVIGSIPRSNPTSGQKAYLSRLSVCANPGYHMYLIDRLWQNSGLSVTSTSSQSITPVSLPARDLAGTSNGIGVEFAIEVSSTMGNAAGSATLTYTDQDGNTGATGTTSWVQNAPVGTFELFTLAGGDTGVRGPTAIQLSASRLSGAFSLVGFRRIAYLDSSIGALTAIDPIAGGLPQIYDDSVLQFLILPTLTTAAYFSGTYQEAHG